LPTAFQSPAAAIRNLFPRLQKVRDLFFVSHNPAFVGRHHFFCTKRGPVRDFYSEDFDGLTVPGEVKAQGQGR
jgi:hypothetical protein